MKSLLVALGIWLGLASVCFSATFTNTFTGQAAAGFTITTGTNFIAGNASGDRLEFNGATKEIRAELGGNTRMQIRPAESSGIAVPYSLDTSVAHTSGLMFLLRNLGTNLFSVLYDGGIRISGKTNIVTDSGTELLYNGVAIGGNGAAGVTNYFDYTFITNNYFISGKGNTVVVSNNITLLGNLTLPWLENGSTVIDWATNSHWFTLASSPTFTFSNATNGNGVFVALEQNNTGGFVPAWPSGIVWPNTNGTTAIDPATNANAVTFYSFTRRSGTNYCDGYVSRAIVGTGGSEGFVSGAGTVGKLSQWTSATVLGDISNQTSNTVFAGPTSGSAAAPTFRALVSADLPAGVGTQIVTNYIRFPWITLTLTTTNVSTVNLDSGTVFKLNLTTNGFFGAPSGLPGTNLAQTIQIHLQQDATGGRTITLTNSSWVLSGSSEAANAVPTINTNANGVTILTFASSPFSATKLYGVPTVFTP